MSSTNRVRRGNVSIEYVLLAALVGGVAFAGFMIPGQLSAMLEMSGANMGTGGVERVEPPSASATVDDDGTSAGDDDASTGGGGTGGLPGGDDDDFGDDAWSGNDNQGCNQGKGNGAEGCDPGNSNQGDPDRSNDEPDATGRN